jgi:hypothetical protein
MFGKNRTIVAFFCNITVKKKAKSFGLQEINIIFANANWGL